MNTFELKILDFIHSILGSTFSDNFFAFITRFSDGGIFFIILGLVLLIFKKTRKVGITVLLSIIIGYITGNLIIKNVVARTRPYDVNTALEIITKRPTDYSFPSGHTLVAIESAFSIFFYNKKWGSAALVLAALIGLSRMYLYVHYPTDVFVGALLGFFTALAAKKITDLIYTKLSKNNKV